MSDPTPLPRSPWLRRRFCCPPTSSLPMATSELLRRTAGFIAYCQRLYAAQKVPTFICQSFLTCPRPYSDGPKSRPRIKTLGWAFASLIKARRPYCPHTGPTCGDFHEAATFTYRYGPPTRSPRSGRDFYHRACLHRIAPCAGRLLLQEPSSHSWPDSHRLLWQPCGLQHQGNQGNQSEQ